MENFLTRCIYSVCRQTYTNLQIILVDDGSTDRSSQICDEFSRMDERIQVIHKTNGGLSSARNEGLSQALGEYIYFLDSDDYIESNLIEKMINVMETVGSDWCGVEAVKESEKGEKLYQISFRAGEYLFRTDEDKWKFLLGPFLNYLVGWEVCFHIFRRKIIEQNKLRFVDERQVYAEDLLFSFSYLLYSTEVVILPDVLYHYTDRQESILHESKGKNIFPQLHFLVEKMYEEVQRSGNSLIKDRFQILYLSIMEWHARLYIMEYGVEWVKKNLLGNLWMPHISENYFLREYQKDVEKYGKLCGVISVIITLSKGCSEKIEHYVEEVLNQSIQRLDIVIVHKNDCQIRNKDCRIRYIRVKKMIPSVIFKKGMKLGFGEYIFFADVEAAEDIDFLRSLSDAVKYNQCDVGVMCESIQTTEICDASQAKARKRMTGLLKKVRLENASFIFRREYWIKEKFWRLTSVLKGKFYGFSGKIVFYKR